MKKYRYFIAFFLVLFVLQFSFLPLISVYGIVPDLLLLATVSYAFLRGSAWGGFIGFALGLMEDLSVGSFFGLHAFTLTLIGLFFGRFADRVFKEQFFLPITASVAATFAKYVISAWLSFQPVPTYGACTSYLALLSVDLCVSDSLGDVPSG